jgi:hypothetical protein
MTKLTVAFRNFAIASKSGVAHARALRDTNRSNKLEKTISVIADKMI